MPLLPWKTTRATRISQIVADLQSPKRGGSLVVETGFPTSLVDLFVKHRDRLRKSSTRRKSKKKSSKHEIYDPITQLASPTSPPSQMNPSGSAVSCIRRDNLEINGLKILEEAQVVGDHGCELVRNRTETCVVGGGAVGGSNVCMVALKMFVVAVLALSTKKLVVGITLSASLLLLLEFVGIHAVRFLQPCAHGEAALKFLILKVSRHLWNGKDDPVVHNSGNCEQESVSNVSLADAFPNESAGSPELSSSIEEIQLVEPNVDASETPEGIEDEKYQLDFHGDETENKDGSELRVCENQRGTRGKLNGKMFKKLVRKRSGSQVIEKKNTDELEFRSEKFNLLGVGKISIEEEDENQEQEQEENGEPRSILCKEEKDNGKPPGFDEQWQAMEVAEPSEIQGIEREGSLSYPILVVIVLAGLFGGRTLAVMLTTAGCFIFKMNVNSRRGL